MVHVTSRRRASSPLKLQSDRIHDVHVQCDQQTNRTLVPARDDETVSKATRAWYADAPQSRRSKAHRATDIHRITKHVEREALDAGVHKDTEIIAQEGTRNTE